MTILLGAAPGQSGHPQGAFTADTLAHLEFQTGRAFDLVRAYRSNLTSTIFGSTSFEKIASDSGHTIVLSLKLTPYSWAQVAAGSADAALTARANDLIAYGLPVYLTFHHEPDNGDGPAADYAAMFQYVRNYFDTAGVTNVTYYWCMTGYSGNSTFWTPGYPGDAYVDWLSYDPYGNVPGAFDTFYTWATSTKPGSHTMPIMIAETAERDPDSGTTKAAWFSDLETWLSTHTYVQALLYWNDRTSTITDYYVDSSPAALAAWQAFAASAIFTGGGSPPPDPPPTPPPTPPRGIAGFGPAMIVNDDWTPYTSGGSAYYADIDSYDLGCQMRRVGSKILTVYANTTPDAGSQYGQSAVVQARFLTADPSTLVISRSATCDVVDYSTRETGTHKWEQFSNSWTEIVPVLSGDYAVVSLRTSYHRSDLSPTTGHEEIDLVMLDCTGSAPTVVDTITLDGHDFNGAMQTPSIGRVWDDVLLLGADLEHYPTSGDTRKVLWRAFAVSSSGFGATADLVEAIDDWVTGIGQSDTGTVLAAIDESGGFDSYRIVDVDHSTLAITSNVIAPNGTSFTSSTDLCGVIAPNSSTIVTGGAADTFVLTTDGSSVTLADTVAHPVGTRSAWQHYDNGPSVGRTFDAGGNLWLLYTTEASGNTSMTLLADALGTPVEHVLNAADITGGILTDPDMSWGRMSSLVFDDTGVGYMFFNGTPFVDEAATPYGKYIAVAFSTQTCALYTVQQVSARSSAVSGMDVSLPNSVAVGNYLVLAVGFTRASPSGSIVLTASGLSDQYSNGFWGLDGGQDDYGQPRYQDTGPYSWISSAYVTETGTDVHIDFSGEIVDAVVNLSEWHGIKTDGSDYPNDAVAFGTTTDDNGGQSLTTLAVGDGTYKPDYGFTGLFQPTQDALVVAAFCTSDAASDLATTGDPNDPWQALVGDIGTTPTLIVRYTTLSASATGSIALSSSTTQDMAGVIVGYTADLSCGTPITGTIDAGATGLFRVAARDAAPLRVHAFVHSISNAGGNPILGLDANAAVTGLKYSYSFPGGPEEASFNLNTDGYFNHQALVQGSDITFYVGADVAWSGKIDEITRGIPWSIRCIGLGSLAKDYVAYAPSSNNVFDLNEVIDEAITRGLPWVRPDVLVTSGQLDAIKAKESASIQIDQALSTVARDLKSFWQVNPATHAVEMVPKPTVVGLLVLASDLGGSRTLNSYVTTYFVRYVNNSDVVSVEIVSDPDAIARFGTVESLLSVTDRGPMSNLEARAIGEAALDKVSPRARYTNTFTTTYGQVLTVGGSPIDLATVRPGPRMRILITDLDAASEVNQSVPIELVLKRTEYEADTDVLSLEPVDSNITNLVQSLGGGNG